MKNMDKFTVQIDRNSTVPTYRQLSDRIAGLIRSDEIHIGEFLPTENQICELSGLSRMTVRKAVEVLVRQGLVEAVRGKGTYVVSKDHLEQGKYSVGFVLRPERYIDEDPFYSQLLMGVTHEAQKHHVQLAFISSESTPEPRGPKRQYTNLKQLSGLIVAGQMPQAFLEDIQRIRIPFVFLNYYAPEYACDAVTVDQYEIGRMVGRHLVELGHSHCLYLSGEPDNVAYEKRLAGFQDVFLTNPMRRLHVMKGGKQSQSGREMVSEALTNQLPFTAVAAGNDMMAIGAMNELQDRGFRVPADISVCGVDNITSASNCRPALTTIQIEKQEMGKRALRLLLKRLRYPNKIQETVFLGVTPIVRESTAAAPVSVRKKTGMKPVTMAG